MLKKNKLLSTGAYAISDSGTWKVMLPEGTPNSSCDIANTHLVDCISPNKCVTKVNGNVKSKFSCINGATSSDYAYLEPVGGDDFLCYSDERDKQYTIDITPNGEYNCVQHSSPSSSPSPPSGSEKYYCTQPATNTCVPLKMPPQDTLPTKPEDADNCSREIGNHPGSVQWPLGKLTAYDDQGECQQKCIKPIRKKGGGGLGCKIGDAGWCNQLDFITTRREKEQGLFPHDAPYFKIGSHCACSAWGEGEVQSQNKGGCKTWGDEQYFSGAMQCVPGGEAKYIYSNNTPGVKCQ